MKFTKKNNYIKAVTNLRNVASKVDKGKTYIRKYRDATQVRLLSYVLFSYKY